MSEAAALLAPKEFDLAGVVEAIGHYGLEIRASHLPVNSKGDLAGPHARVVLILPQGSPLDLSDLTAKIRRLIGTPAQLFLCCPQLAAADRADLVSCGASGFLTPRAWSTGAVTERILADFILAGEVKPSSLGTLHGGTDVMCRLYRDIETMAKTSETILVLGETGTGKELVAREIHRNSGRPGHLTAINCAALTPELLESELFGHERGAFSGAVATRRGLLAEAGEGTVFLDEIGDLAPSAQAKMLRVIEERTVRPVGGNRWSAIQARFVLATHRNLEENSQGGTFRQDLFERIRGFSLRLPPLRDRRADILLLLRHFVLEYDAEYGGKRTLPADALDPLFRYDWPGNVRELRQAVRRAAAFADSKTGPVSIFTLLEVVHRGRSAAAQHSIAFDPVEDSWHAVQDRARIQYFRAILAEAGGNREAAAKRAGLGRSQFYEILKQIAEFEQSG
jgi:transcriptional regulator with GAF, ATPase, and Fis domain